ncbi:hypothetical protein ACGFZK_09290 [Streptomyces sp. NPDC048257]|uniref:hypothetical protein n=1 Tax=Streptomyces sp. NPDC048257 TaxID=3365526 RepID=UPI003719F5F0
MRARLHPLPRTGAEYRSIQRVIGHGPDCTRPTHRPHLLTLHTFENAFSDARVLAGQVVASPSRLNFHM